MKYIYAGKAGNPLGRFRTRRAPLPELNFQAVKYSDPLMPQADCHKHLKMARDETLFLHYK